MADHADPTPTDERDSEEVANENAAANEQRDDDATNPLESEIPEDKKAFVGQTHGTEHWVAATYVNSSGNEVVELKPRNWVGPGLEIAPTQVGEVKDALGKVKNLPKG